MITTEQHPKAPQTPGAAHTPQATLRDSAGGSLGPAANAPAAAGPLRETIHRSWWDRHGRATTVWGLRGLVLAGFLALWQLLSGPVLDETFLSKPSQVLERLVEWIGDGTLLRHSAITLQEILLGFAIGAVAGALFGYLLASLSLIYEVLDPFMMALYSIPKVALAPLFIVWFGIGLEMKVILAAVSVFFLVFLNTAAGVREVDRGLIDAVRLMGGTRWEVIRKVILPHSTGGVLTGLKVAIPYALIGAVIGELVASNQGLGYLINDSVSQFDIAGVFAAVAVLTVLAAVLNLIVGTVSTRLNKWKPSADAA